LATAAIMLAPVQCAAGTGDVFAMPTLAIEDLDALRWKNRPVLVFAPSAEDPAFMEQTASLRAAREGLIERDVVVLSDTEPHDNGSLRRRFAVQGFEVLLIGKDGGVKLRVQRPVAAEVLFSEIDAMPMRRREMSD
jgi:hypothetical protein